MRESVTSTIVTGEVREPNPVATAVPDYMGVGAALTQNKGLGAASSLLSLAIDPTPKNALVTGASTVIPMIVEGSDVPIAFGSAAYNGSRFAGQVMTDVFTPDALQSDTIPDGNGHVVRVRRRFSIRASSLVRISEVTDWEFFTERERPSFMDWWNSPISSPYYSLIVGVISFSVAVVSTCTGKAYGRYAGWASRAKKPTEFW